MNFQVNLNICRVCMKGDDVQALLGDNDLQRKFEFTTHLMLSADDNMPKNICSNCVLRLKVSYEFIQLAHNSEENLKAFLVKIKNDFQLVTQAQTLPNVAVADHKPIEMATTASATNAGVANASVTEHLPVVGGKKARKSLLAPLKRERSFLKKSHMHEMDVKTPLSIDSEEVVCVAAGGDYGDGDDYESSDCAGVVKASHEANFMYDDNIDMKAVYMADMAEADTDANETASDTEMEVLEEVLPLASDATDSQSGDLAAQSPQSNDLKEFVVMMSNNDDDDNEEGGEEAEDDHDDDEENVHGNGNGVGVGDVAGAGARAGEESNGECVSIKEEILWVKDTADENSIEELQIYEDTDDVIHDPEASSECASETNDFLPDSDAVLVDIENAAAAAAGVVVLRVPQPAVKSMQRKATTTTAATAASGGGRMSKAVLENTRFYCMKCNKDFTTKTNLTRHMATHDGARPYVCKICGNSFTQNGTLKQHMYTHTGEKPYVCKYCDRGFTQYKTLVFHMRRHTGDKPFHCEHCDLYFRQKDGLKVHILKHHMVTKRNGDSQTHTCVICKMVLSTKSELLIHMKKHLNSKVLQRDDANRKSNNNADIILELMEENVLLEQKDCVDGVVGVDVGVADGDDIASGGGVGNDGVGVGSDHTDDLSSHALGIAAQVLDVASSSTDEPRRVKKYLCPKCYKCFAIKRSLIRHMSIHDVSVSALYRCDICELAFDTNRALRMHTVREHKHHTSSIGNDTHTNRNACVECNVHFASGDELHEHMIAMHDFDYFCPICVNVKFNTEKQLMTHMLTHDLATDGDGDGDDGDGVEAVAAGGGAT